MPIGTSKIGLMGAGIAPGGSETFNSTGTFCAPPGISLVNVTGLGGEGGDGGTGNAGGPGVGGSGGNSPSRTGPGYGQPGLAGGSGFIGPGDGPGNPGFSGSPGAASTVFCLNLPGGIGGAGGAGGSSGTAGNNGGTGLILTGNGFLPLNGPGGAPCGAKSTAPVSVNTFFCKCNGIAVVASGGYGGGGAGTFGYSTGGCGRLGGSNCGGPGGIRGAILVTNAGGNTNQASSYGAPGFAAKTGGGGGGGGAHAVVPQGTAGGGGGGGGRGSTGGGSSGTGGLCGSPANPTTHNCVSIVGGSAYPVTVNGQVNISWCPQ